MRLRKNKKWKARRQTRDEDQQETGKRAVKVVLRHARPRDPRLRHVIQNGPAESFTLLGVQHGLKFRLYFILDNGQGCARVASTLNRLDQSDFAAAFGYTIHDIHDRIDNPPRDIAADGGEQKLANSASPLIHR